MKFNPRNSRYRPAHVNTARDTRSPEEQDRDMAAIRERLYRHLDLMDGLNRVRRYYG